MKKTVVTCGGVATVLLLLVGLLDWYSVRPLREMERRAHSMVGRSEAELVTALGLPRHVVTAASLEGRTVDYPWKGMSFVPIPTRPVRSKVLLYSKLDMAIYVYLDEHGVVEHVAIART